MLLFVDKTTTTWSLEKTVVERLPEPSETVIYEKIRTQINF